MRTSETDNYLMGRGLRFPFGLVVVTGALFAAVCILLWYWAVNPRINQTGPLLHLIALAATVMTGFGIPKLVENYHFFQFRFEIGDNRIVLENKKEVYTFDLGQDFLVTRYTFRLATGKASACAPMFCLMRPDNPYSFRKTDGIGPMKAFLKSGGILLPRHALSQLMYATELTHIPEYPQTVGCKGK